MTTGTSSVNTTMKVQNTAAKTNTKAAVEQASVDFSSLFSSAKLNSFESQMREALGKDTVSKAPSQNKKETQGQAPAMPDPQAMVWAQHSWMAEQQRPNINVTPQNTDHQAAQTRPVETRAEANDGTSPEQPQTTRPAESANNSPAKAQAPETTEPQQVSANVPAPQDSSAGKTSHAFTPLDVGASTPLNTSAMNMGTESSSQTQTITTDFPSVTGNASAAAQAIQGSSHEPGTRKVSRSDDSPQGLTFQATASSDLPQASQTVDTRGNAPAMDPNALARLPIQAALAAQTQATNASAQEMPADELSIKAGDSKLTTANLNPALANLPGQSGFARGTAPAVTVRTPVNQPGFAKELGQTVNWALGKQLSTVELRVNPESFGPMNLKIVQKGQELHITIRTQDESSANLMAQAVSGLKETMAQNGLQLNQVTVQHSQGFNLGQSAGDPNSAQTAQQGQEGQQSSGRQSGKHAEGEALAAGASTTAGTRSNTNPGGLDLFA